MAERKVKVIGPEGKIVDGFEVPVLESHDRFTEIKLEDGTVIRGKLVVTGAVRLEGSWDADGNPAYSIKQQAVFSVVESPDKLRRKVQ